jgi:phosphatidylglycerol---prolipoprotein diacylglyceryl transferase
MYPDLSYLLSDMFHTPIDNWASTFKTYGSSLVITFLVCSLLLRGELLRREKIGKIRQVIITPWAIKIENFLIIVLSTLLGYKIIYLALYYKDLNFDIREAIFSLEGNVIGASLMFLVSFFIVHFSKIEAKNNQDTVISFHRLSIKMNIFIILTGFLGMKLFGIIENNIFGKTFFEILNKSQTNFYGGLVGGLLAGYIFCRACKVSFDNLLDAIAPIMMLGYAMGRIGCHLSGDGCWGIENHLSKPNWLIIPNWLWSNSYPHNILDKGVKMTNFEGRHAMILENLVYPTSLYEAIFGIISFLILWKLKKIITKPYYLFLLFALLMGIERFFIEFIRINPKYSFSGLYLSQAQYISLFLIFGSISFFVLKSRLPTYFQAKTDWRGF